MPLLGICVHRPVFFFLDFFCNFSSLSFTWFTSPSWMFFMCLRSDHLWLVLKALPLHLSQEYFLTSILVEVKLTTAYTHVKIPRWKKFPPEDPFRRNRVLPEYLLLSLCFIGFYNKISAAKCLFLLITTLLLQSSNAFCDMSDLTFFLFFLHLISHRSMWRNG